MKRTIFLLACTALLWSCSESPLLEEPPVQVSDVLSRAMTTPDAGVSESNPDLIADWENQTKVVLNSGAVEELPWSDNGVSTQLSTDFCKSVKKKDGWTMLAHTFQKVGESKRQNYMVFYNLFTGVMKVFYFYEGNQSSTNAQWFVQAIPVSGSVKYKFLDVPEYFARPDNEPSINTNNLLAATNESAVSTNRHGIPNGLVPGWNGFDFQVSRYADDLTDCDFKIGAYITNVTESSFNGNLNLSTSGTITSTTKVASANDGMFVNGIATYAGDKAENAIKGLKDASENQSTGIKIANTIADLVGGMAKEGIVGVLKAGLNLIFGRSTSVKTYETTSDVRLTSEGTITLSGLSSCTTTTDVPTITFNLKKVLEAQTRPVAVLNSPVVLLANSGGIVGPPVLAKTSLKNLGVWTLKSRPKAYWNLTKKFTPTKFEDEGGDVLITGSAACPTISKYDLEVEFNPYINPWIKSHKATVKFLAYVKNNNVHPGGFEPDLMYWVYSDPYKSLYNFTNSATFTALVGVQANTGTSTEIMNVESFYVKWSLPKAYDIIAFVTVEMNVSYNGNAFTVTETRAYKTDNVAISGEPVTQMPTILVFDGMNSWLTMRQFK